MQVIVFLNVVHIFGCVPASRKNPRGEIVNKTHDV